MDDGWDSAAAVIRRYLHAFTPEIMFDVGANEGKRTQRLAESFPGARIYAFEPMPEPYRAAFRIAQHDMRIKAYRLALSNVNAPVAMTTDPDTGQSRVIAPDASELSRVEVKAEMGTSFCAARGIERVDYLRIGAAGHALQILYGFTPMLREQRIQLIEVEVSLSAEDQRHVPMEAVQRQLEPLGYSVFWLYDRSRDLHLTGRPALKRIKALFISNRAADANGFGTSLFICGCGHTGTTLLATMFAANPHVHIPLLETEMFLKPHTGAEGYRRLRAEAIDAGKHHLAEKTPRHIRHLDRLRATVPDARIVAMVRDGRDVAASFIKRMGNAAAGAERWIADTRLVAAEIGAPDMFVQRYEDLVRDPEGCLRRICAFAGIPYDPAMLDYHAEQRLWFDQTEVRRGNGREGIEHRALRTWQVNQPIYDDSGKWRTMLTEADLRPFLEGEGRDLLELFGYDPDIPLG